MMFCRGVQIFFSCGLLRRVQQVLLHTDDADGEFSRYYCFKEKGQTLLFARLAPCPRIWFLFVVERLEIRTVWALRERPVT